jgi:hypothetical protein
VTTTPDQRSPDREDRGGASGGGRAPGQGQGQRRRKPKPAQRGKGQPTQGQATGGQDGKGQGRGGKGAARQGQAGKSADRKGEGAKGRGTKGAARQGQGGKATQGRGRRDPHRRDQPDETVAQLAGPVQKVLGRLPETQRRVLELRMGLADGHPHDLADTARELGLSLGEAREIEQRAFEHIREAIPLQQLQRFLPR